MATADQYQGYAPPITRSLVLDFLQDTEEPNDVQHHDSLESLASSYSLSSSLSGTFHTTVDNDTALQPRASLENIRLWLDAQCNAERAQADWTNEYRHSSQGDAERLALHSRGPDTAVMDRIRKGYGPRSAKYEDLLWPLRSNHLQETSRFSKHPRNESYKAMKQVLLDWNKQVATAYEDPQARKTLRDAMYARTGFLERILSYRRSADAHDETSRKLLHAIYDYRPETIAFKQTDTCDLLTIILAHIGFAIPDIDQELKYLIFYTLVTERVHMAHTANAGTRRKLQEEITRAKQQLNEELVIKYEQKMRDWQRDIFQHNCDLIAEKVKFARRNVELNAFQELETLAVLQTAQKTVLDDRLSRKLSPADILNPRSTWLPAHSALADSAAIALSSVTDIHLPSLLASVTLASENNHDMEHTARARILTRALKFAGLDVKNVSENERRRLVKTRMANPGTVDMMWDAIEGIAETKAKATDVVDTMGTMEKEMEEVLAKANELMEEYETLAKLVDTEVLADVEAVDESGGVE